MGLFMDGNGFPLAFSIQSGNTNEQTTLCPLEQQIVRDFSLSKFVVCTDAGLSSAKNRLFNNVGNRAYVTTQSLKKLKTHLKEWALDPSGWSAQGVEGTFDLTEILDVYDDEGTDEAARRLLRERTYYKKRPMKEADKESLDGFFTQELIVTFSIKHRDYARSVRPQPEPRQARFRMRYAEYPPYHQVIC